VQVLDGQSAPIEVGGTPLWVAGVDYDREGRIPQTLASVPAGAFSIFLYHTPDEVATVAEQGADLYCAGHIHGGQIALPFYGALVTLSRYGKQYESGLHRVGRTQLYVNRGIGMEGGRIPRVRFCSRPEITVIEVHPVDIK
jgi:predicted MPP superfamily phosphohydrolase